MKTTVEMRSTLEMVLARLSNAPLSAEEWDTIVSSLQDALVYAKKMRLSVVDKTWLDEDVRNGTPRTTLVLGQGESTVNAVREAVVDWGLIQYAGPHLHGIINIADRAATWLVAIVDANYDALDRDDAVLAYGPAWRKVR